MCKSLVWNNILKLILPGKISLRQLLKRKIKFHTDVSNFLRRKLRKREREREKPSTQMLAWENLILKNLINISLSKYVRISNSVNIKYFPYKMQCTKTQKLKFSYQRQLWKVHLLPLFYNSFILYTLLTITCIIVV